MNHLAIKDFNSILNQVKSTYIYSKWGFFDHIEIEATGTRFKFPVWKATGEVFNNDPTIVNWSKCILLTIYTPMLTLARMISHIAKGIFSKNSTVKDGFIEAGRAAKYGMLMTLVSSLGILSPKIAKRFYGLFERTLHRQPEGPYLQENEERRDSLRKHYAAICFQPLIIPKEKISQVTPFITERLVKYLIKQRQLHVIVPQAKNT